MDMDKDNSGNNLPELKDERFHYHYSRDERLRLKRSQEAPSNRLKESIMAKIAGPNKSVRSFIVIYILFAALAWGLFSIYHKSNGSKDEKIFNLPLGRAVAVRLVDRKERKGLNILIHNKSTVEWIVTNLTINIDGQTRMTNPDMILKSGDFEAVFVPAAHLTNGLNSLKLEVNN